MKMINFFAAAAAMLICPVLLCSCGTDAKVEQKTESAVAEPEIKSEPKAEAVKAEPKAEAVKSEPKAETVKSESKTAEKKAEPKPDNGTPKEKSAVAEKKAESAPAPAAAPVQEMKKADKPDPRAKKHLVRTGDNLWKISQKYYGTGLEWKRIYEANKTEIRNKDLLEPGTILTIPAAK